MYVYFREIWKSRTVYDWAIDCIPTLVGPILNFPCRILKCQFCVYPLSVFCVGLQVDFPLFAHVSVIHTRLSLFRSMFTIIRWQSLLYHHYHYGAVWESYNLHIMYTLLETGIRKRLTILCSSSNILYLINIILYQVQSKVLG